MAKDRIKSFRKVPAGDLIANPRNWREHDVHQTNILRQLLDTVGFVGAVIARKTTHGLEIINGHLRADIAAVEKVPCLIVDLTQEEADKVLATYDPIRDMADSDQNKLNSLIHDLRENPIGEDFGEIDQFLSSLADTGDGALLIPDGGEQELAHEYVQFRQKWRLPIDSESMDKLETKCKQYLDTYMTTLGLVERMLECLPA